MPVEDRLSSVAHRSLAMLASSPAVGSSNNSAAGFCSATSSQPMLTRFSWPPLMLAGAFGPPASEGTHEEGIRAALSRSNF